MDHPRQDQRIRCVDEQNLPYSQTRGGKWQMGSATRVGVSLGRYFRRGGGLTVHLAAGCDGKGSAADVDDSPFVTIP